MYVRLLGWLLRKEVFLYIYKKLFNFLELVGFFILFGLECVFWFENGFG